MKTTQVACAIVTLCVLASARASLVAHQDDGPWPPPGVYVVSPGNGVTLPQLVRQVGPQFTSDAMRAQIQGVVGIGCVVEVDGSVGATRVLRSLDRFYGLDDNALKAAKQWRFTPGMKDGVAVPVAITIDMTFTLGSAPRLSWPESFASAPTPDDNASVRTDDDVDASGLRIHISVPAAWSLKKNNAAGASLVEANNRSRPRLLRIQQPQPAQVRLTQPVAPFALERLTEAVGQSLTRSAANSKTLAVGQGRTSGRFWIWFDMWFAAADAPPEFREASAAIDGIRVWTFVTTEEQQQIRVSCYALKPNGVTDTQWLDEVHQAGAEFNGILQRISIGPHP